MKSLKTNLIAGLLCLFTISVSLISCNDDDSSATAAPTILSVSDAQKDSLVTQGYAGAMYIIRGKHFTGTQKIYINNVDTYFNSTLIKDDVIIITIDRNTPYENTPNEIKVVTGNGSAVYSFIVAPPAPILKSFNPVNAAEGEQITIYGSYFLDPVVTIGGVQAQVVSNTMTEIVAIVPPGANHKLVTVTTISGDSESKTPIGTALYDDAWYSPWTMEAWNNHEYVTDEAKAAQGTTFIKKTINGWDNIQGNWAWDANLSEYTGIRFSIRSDDPGKLVTIFNGQFWGDATHSFITTTEWKEYRFTWEELGGKPEALQNLSFQEFTGAAHTYYFDNIGYTLD